MRFVKGKTNKDLIDWLIQ